MAYVYYSYEQFGRGYIGFRNRDPEGDEAYLGSFRDSSFQPTEKIILATFAEAHEALAAEIALHEFFDVARNPHFANRAIQTSDKFICHGRPAGFNHSEEAKRNQRIAALNRSPISDETSRKISESTKKSWEDPAYREKVLSKRRGRKQSEETKRKISEARKKWWKERNA